MFFNSTSYLLVLINEAFASNPDMNADFTLTEIVTESVVLTNVETFTQTETNTATDTITELNTIAVDFTETITSTDYTTSTVNSEMICYFETCTTSIIDVYETTTFTSIVISTNIDTESTTITTFPYITIAGTSTTTDTYTSYLTSSVTTSTDSVFSFEVAVCSEVHTNYSLAFMNLQDYFSSESNRLNNFQQSTFLPAYGFYVYINNVLNFADSNSTMQILFAQMMSQLTSYEVAQLIALLNGQSQSQQLAAFVAYQNAQMNLLFNFQASRTLNPAFAALPLSEQSFITASAFPYESSAYSVFQASEYSIFTVFQASQSILY